METQVSQWRMRQEQRLNEFDQARSDLLAAHDVYLKALDRFVRAREEIKAGFDSETPPALPENPAISKLKVHSQSAANRTPHNTARRVLEAIRDNPHIELAGIARLVGKREDYLRDKTLQDIGNAKLGVNDIGHWTITEKGLAFLKSGRKTIGQ